MSFNTQKSTILTNFCNPEIPGLGRRQSRDSGLTKKAGIRDPGIANTSPGVNLNDIVRLAISENHTLEPEISTLSYTQPKL